MSSWYYADANGSLQGPADGTDLARWLGEGRLHWGTLVWREGMGDWRPMSDFSDEFTALAAGATPTAAVAPAAASAMLDLSTASVVPSAASASAPQATPGTRSDSPYAPPSAPLLTGTGVHVGNEVVYAGFWKRMAAYIIDAFIMGIASYAVQIPVFLMMFGVTGFKQPTSGMAGGAMALTLVVAYLVPIVIQMLYYAWFHASGRQATPGKMAVGIKVVDDAGAPISFARGIGRYFAFLLSGFTIGVGYVMAGFTDRKRGLHDMIASTLVVDRWAYTERPELQTRELGTVTIVILVLGGLLFLGIMVAMIGLMASLGLGNQ